uniref:Uncharacterized protein n=1 Tax=Panagrolaimus sp. ES5 TaxID=591445 RepID=A0AC34G0S6_9BILA
MDRIKLKDISPGSGNLCENAFRYLLGDIGDELDNIEVDAIENNNAEDSEEEDQAGISLAKKEELMQM